MVFEVEREDLESGKLQLSPLLNDFACTSTIELTDGQAVKDLRCSSCRRSLGEADVRCELCNSRAARFLVEVDGEHVDFFICMRKGCHWHDISQAARSRMILEAVGFHQRDKQLIQSGSRLDCSCPRCGQDLVEGDDLVVILVGPGGQTGKLLLSPYLNDFRNACDVDLPKNAVADDLLCPHCVQTLVDEERRCNLCGAPAARFAVRIEDGYARIFVCIRRQCHWHHLDDDARAWTLEPG